MEPTTALMIGQAGLSLYQSFRGGGGGLGAMLAAQVRMLAAINSKLDEVGRTVTRIYERVEDLAKELEATPHRTAIEIAHVFAEAQIHRIRELLAEIEAHESVSSREDVLRDPGIRYQANDVLADLAENRIVLQRERSAMFVPVLASCWYADLSLLTCAFEYNRVAVQSKASVYVSLFEALLDKQIVPELRRLNQRLKEQHDAVTAAAASTNNVCLDGLKFERIFVRHGNSGGRNREDQPDIYGRRISWNDVGFKTAPFDDQEIVDQARAQCVELAQEGVPVESGLFEFRLLEWSYYNNPKRLDSKEIRGEAPRDFTERYNLMVSNKCPADRRASWYSDFSEQEQARSNAVLKEIARLAMFGGFYLVAMDARTSAKAVLAAATGE